VTDGADEADGLKTFLNSRSTLSPPVFFEDLDEWLEKFLRPKI
jgi:hypothetical protein